MNATWYGDLYNETRIALNWTVEEFNSFYDVSRTGSFGYTLAKINQFNQDTYGCAEEDSNPLNCSSIELAAIQWGSSAITLSPSIENSNYTAATHTISDWGSYPIQNALYAPEYFYWAQKAHGYTAALT